MIALDLDAAVLDRAARAALLLELGGEGCELVGRQAKAGNHSDAFALAARCLAADTDDTVAGGLAGRAFLANAFAHRPLAVGAALADAGGIDDAAAVGRRFARLTHRTRWGRV